MHVHIRIPIRVSEVYQILNNSLHIGHIEKIKKPMVKPDHAPVQNQKKGQNFFKHK
jgi:hypothetical protein